MTGDSAVTQLAEEGQPAEGRVGLAGCMPDRGRRLPVEDQVRTRVQPVAGGCEPVLVREVLRPAVEVRGVVGLHQRVRREHSVDCPNSPGEAVVPDLGRSNDPEVGVVEVRSPLRPLLFGGFATRFDGRVRFSPTTRDRRFSDRRIPLHRGSRSKQPGDGIVAGQSLQGREPGTGHRGPRVPCRVQGVDLRHLRRPGRTGARSRLPRPGSPGRLPFDHRHRTQFPAPAVRCPVPPAHRKGARVCPNGQPPSSREARLENVDPASSRHVSGLRRSVGGRVRSGPFRFNRLPSRDTGPIVTYA